MGKRADHDSPSVSQMPTERQWASGSVATSGQLTARILLLAGLQSSGTLSGTRVRRQLGYRQRVLGQSRIR